MKRVELALTVVLALVPLTSQAAYIAVLAEGRVLNVDNLQGLLPIPAAIGDPMSIRYVISDVAPPNSSVSPDDGEGLY